MSRICTMYPHFGNFWSIFKLYIPVTEDPDLTEIVVPSITGWSLVSYQSHSITLFADIQKSYDLYWIAIHISIINFHKMDYIKWLVSSHVYGVKSQVGSPTHLGHGSTNPSTCAGRNAWDWMLGFSIPTPAQLVEKGWSRFSIISPGRFGIRWVGESLSIYIYIIYIYILCVCFFLCVFLLCLSVYVEKRALDLSFRTSMWQNTICQYFTMFLCVHKAGEQIDPTISSLKKTFWHMCPGQVTRDGHSGHSTEWDSPIYGPGYDLNL